MKPSLSLREYVEASLEKGKCIRLLKETSLNLELAGLLAAFDGSMVYAEKIKEVEGARVVGNAFCTREAVCECFGIEPSSLIPHIMNAISRPSRPNRVGFDQAPVLQKESPVDLSRLPIPIHAERDGGPYFSSAVVIAKDKELGQNCSFHRMMVIGKNRVAVRILPRHLDEFIKRNGGELDVAFVVGAPINFLLAAACSVELGKDEAAIANSLAPLKVVQLESGIEVPAEAEFVFEGKITRELADEGPFVDLTETYDVVRKQPVMEITRIRHRQNPIWHALLPGGLEHKLLMGMPREPTIWQSVNKVAKCTGVNITPGGCSWLHAVVSITKRREEDGKNAIMAAFEGHKSLKHVVVVDDDIDIYSPKEVEWAIATRVQADRDVVILKGQKGSSLDPSADPHTYSTSKMGIDATKPLVAHGKNFEKAKWMKLKKEDYV